MNDIVKALIYEVNNMQQYFEHVKSQQQDHDFYQIVKPYTVQIDGLLNKLKLHRELIIQVHYMNQRKFELLISNIEQLSVECHFKRTSRKLFIEKLKSVQYDLQNILDGLVKEGIYG
ncbi:TPA: DUF1798 family protein [Staphylococcus argenteus]|uniref:DUF1798 family protein n=1 Tax=Staphylococcus argenteus TaxID=985002 RepID=UPI000500FC42|nr:DUF1798 family protein [Staphylococcus argenteus]MDT3004306.1 DUF1798 family protein [Staphylococcus argenteus]UPO19720.1 YppE family protein [Staphylococcus argenteus]CDR63557.1 Bacterial domain of unknown function (DUF1798) [Staphylococcus argenteus]HDY9445526.1 DUF1798 family protein [Staphylococcus argenteus]HDY9447206.1 DUF1798 family protein [Staphylococcus argenteus]